MVFRPTSIVNSIPQAIDVILQSRVGPPHAAGRGRSSNVADRHFGDSQASLDGERNQAYASHTCSWAVGLRHLCGAGLLILTVLAGCSARTSTGSITGRLLVLEGGSAYRVVHGNGNLVIDRGSQLVATVNTCRQDTEFNISLPIGTCTVQCESTPNAPCPGGRGAGCSGPTPARGRDRHYQPGERG